MKLPKEGTFIVLIVGNMYAKGDVKATGIVTHDPCHTKMVKYIEENGHKGNAYEAHIRSFAEIEVDWEEGLND